MAGKKIGNGKDSAVGGQAFTEAAIAAKAPWGDWKPTELPPAGMPATSEGVKGK